jgi:hypothetical protein
MVGPDGYCSEEFEIGIYNKLYTLNTCKEVKNG